MREVSLSGLEVEIVTAIRQWRDTIIVDNGADSPVSEIDAGDAVALASDIATRIIGHGVGIVGQWSVHRRLNDGW